MHVRKLFVLAVLVIIFFFLQWFTEFCTPAPSNKDHLSAANEYVGDQKCGSCHRNEYESWKTSDHFKAMLPANDSTVLGSFNNTIYSADGVTSRFFKKEKGFFVNTQGPDGKNHDYKILYAFGHYPLQQYLIAFPGGRLQTLRQSWDSKQKKWFHQYAGQKIPHKDWLHWTRDAQNWNTMCASCHSTNLKKNYYTEADSFHTTFSILNVSCEGCHGPGKKHVDFIQSAAYKKGEKVAGAYLVSNKDQTTQLNTCAPCHALRSEISSTLIQSNELLDDYLPEIPNTEHYFSDGQVKDEDYTYTSFLQSKMYHKGVRCSNCHNPHTAKVLYADNRLCLQCHNKKYDAPEHHHHNITSEGALCKSCHMPGRYYMGNDFRHDHNFTVPRPDLSVQYGTPNACNTCHKNKPSNWAAASVVGWFGKERKYHFSEDLVPGSKLDEHSEPHLQRLVKDPATPTIIQATAVFYLGAINTPTSVTTLQHALVHKSALVRYHALRSLANFSPEQWQAQAAPLLSDHVRIVRIAAADLFSTLPITQIPEPYQTAFARAKEELSQYIHYQADFASGNVLIADHYLRAGDYYNAEKFYLRGLKKDSLMNYARLNLSSVYGAEGKSQEAISVLQAAAAIDPKNDRIFFNLGLLFHEMKNTAAAIQYFDKAMSLQSRNPRLYYNYGLLLQQNGAGKKAEQVLLKGLNISSRDADLNYALAYVYVQQKSNEKAKKYAQILKSIDPNNANYQGLFQFLLR